MLLSTVPQGKDIAYGPVLSYFPAEQEYFLFDDPVRPYVFMYSVSHQHPNPQLTFCVKRKLVYSYLILSFNV